VSTLVAFLEEPSAKHMLEAVLPPILPKDCELRCIPFDGKQDLEKNLARKLRYWMKPDSRFLVLRDRDSEDCRAVKRRLVGICRQAGHPETVVRIACGELESFYLGDLSAVSKALGRKLPSNKKAKYRDPDVLNNAAEELMRLTDKAYQKIAGSKAISPYLKTDGTNRSHSFNVLISGVRKLFPQIKQTNNEEKSC